MARGPLPPERFAAIYAEVPRLTVEVVLATAGRVLLSLRETGPCAGLWHLPGGTVRYGEPLREAARRVAESELGLEIAVGRLLGYLEYPSHLARGIDWPVGIAFSCSLAGQSAEGFRPRPGAVEWFGELPGAMHDEQRQFLRRHRLAR